MKDFPQELQYIVAGVLIAELQDPEKHDLALSTLLALRRTSKNLAKTAIITRALFSSVRLQATRDNVTRLQHTDLTSVAPFVRTVTFVATPYFVDLSLDRYLYMREDDCTTDTVHLLRAEWARYRGRAKQDHVMTFRGGELETSWVSVLRIFQFADSFKLPSAPETYTQLLDGLPGTPAPLVDADLLSYASRVTHNNFVHIVQQYLALANSTIKSIRIDYELVKDIHDWRRNIWAYMNLTSLRTLRITSDLDLVEESAVSDEEDILLGGPSQLEDFEYAHKASSPRVDLPSLGSNAATLRSVRLEGVQIESADSFAADILLMPMLEDLYLENCMAPESTWKPVFGALHHHKKPKPLRVEFKDVINFWLADNASVRFSFAFSLDSTMDSTKFERELSKLARTPDWNTKYRTNPEVARMSSALAASTPQQVEYLCNRGMWTDCLERLYAIRP